MRPALAPVARFAAAGLLNTMVGFTGIVIALWLRFGDVPANLIGFAAGLSVGFIVNRKWTFRAEGQTNPAEIVRYLLAFGVSWGLNIAIVLMGIRLGMAGSAWVQFTAIGAYSAVFFALSRWFVFTGKQTAQRG